MANITPLLLSVVINAEILKIENTITIFNNVIILKYINVNNIRIFHLNTVKIYYFFTANPKNKAI
jgi:hypothetical protein